MVKYTLTFTWKNWYNYGMINLHETSITEGPYVWVSRENIIRILSK